MANYTKSTDFAAKDSLPTGYTNKIVRGSEIDNEFANIQTAVNSKADKLSPVLEGTPEAPTATFGTNTTQIATTAFVTSATANINTLDTWTIEESGGVLYFKMSGVSKAKLDASGNLTVVGNVTAYGTI